MVEFNDSWLRFQQILHYTYSSLIIICSLTSFPRLALLLPPPHSSQNSFSLQHTIYIYIYIMIKFIHITHTIQLRSNTKKLVICGQALSHCVNYTVRDIVSQWSPSSPSSITILKDCTSSVPGFEEAGEKFLQDMMEVGVNVETSDSFVPWCERREKCSVVWRWW